MSSPRQQRKVWVCERGATATSVHVQRGELVDDVKTQVLLRYANSLGKTLDAADLTITITPRVRGPSACHERSLDPDEDICHVLDCYFPGGQKLAEALIVATSLSARRNSSLGDIHNPRALPPGEGQTHGSSAAPATPQRSLCIREIQPTPQSNRKQLQLNGLTRSVSAGTAPASIQPSLKAEATKSSRDLFNSSRTSPRPQTIRRDSNPSEDASSRKPLSRNPSTRRSPFLRPSPESRSPSSYFPPASARATTPNSATGQSLLNNNSTSGKHKKSNPSASKPSKPKSKPRRPLIRPLVQLDGAIPPINVLIAEDNSLVSRVVSKQMQQLNVRWDTATNGLEAINKWKAGKFHLIFMDIGMPVMDGLAATKEIRRLERGESEGLPLQPKLANQSPEEVHAISSEEVNGDTLDCDWDESQPKGIRPIAADPPQQRAPVIIVALTASSLPSDRDGALNAGCNDFITKPLEQVWLAQKVKEWGCMQALIDYEEWRIWKGYQIR